ncbi:MAG TPA: M56 family metallopeptidase [Chitinophagaceae bacterium]|jgi:TonB family protein|nr:M56 family metallopeptidase [Chitinophagaceae bacterium]
MALYFLKTILLLGIFYSFYLLWLQREKSFRFNRFYLLVTPLLSMIIPLLPTWKTAQTLLPTTAAPLTIALQTITVYSKQVQAKELSAAGIVLAIYIAGVLWGLIRVSLGLLVIRRLKQGAHLQKVHGELIYFHESIESPFSFRQDIFVPMSLRDSPSMSAILEHENAHIRLHHSRDKIYFSVLQAFLWMNPMVYVCHKEIELVHEFQADAASTDSITTDDYIENLLQTVRYTQTPTLLAHHFFQHPLKTRITMLYTSSRNVMAQKSFITVACLLICMLALFLQSYADKKTSKEAPAFVVRSATVDTVEVEDPATNSFKTVYVQHDADTLYNMTDDAPEFYGGMNVMMTYLSDNIKYPESAKKANIEGKVLVQFVVTKEGEIEEVKSARFPTNGEALRDEAVRVVSNMPKWKPGKVNGKNVKVNFALPVMFKLK